MFYLKVQRTGSQMEPTSSRETHMLDIKGTVKENNTILNLFLKQTIQVWGGTQIIKQKQDNGN